MSAIGSRSFRTGAPTRSRAAIVAAALLVLLAHGRVVPAATILWGPAQGVSGDSDVDSTGSLVYAYNFGSGVPSDPTEAVSTTINGVTFAPFAVTSGDHTATVGSVTLTETYGPYSLYSDASLGSVSAPYSTLSTEYKDLLRSEVYAGAVNTLQVDLGGLTVGQSYRVQLWSSFANYSYNSLFDSTSIASGSSSRTLDSNTSNSEGGLGQWVVGTFTADSVTQQLDLTGSSGLPMINGLQVRLDVAPVPEIDPTGAGSAVALALGALGALERRRRPRAA